MPSTLVLEGRVDKGTNTLTWILNLTFAYYNVCKKGYFVSFEKQK